MKMQSPGVHDLGAFSFGGFPGPVAAGGQPAGKKGVAYRCPGIFANGNTATFAALWPALTLPLASINRTCVLEPSSDEAKGLPVRIPFGPVPPRVRRFF